MIAWRSDFLEIPELSFAMTPAGGVGEFSRGRIVIVNPTEAGILFTDLFDAGLLDGAELDFWAIFLTDYEVTEDRILLGGGEIISVAYDVRSLTLEWLDRAAKRYRSIPTAHFEFIDYPYAFLANVGKVKPVVLGNMTGQAFDLADGGTDGVWRHVPCPLIDGATPGYYLFDAVAGDGEREQVIVLDDIPCELVADHFTLAANELKFWTADPDTNPPNLLDVWVRPHRVWAQTSVTNAQYARTDDLDEYATIAAGGSLELAFPGIPDSLGTYAGASAANAKLYIIHSASAGDTIDFDVEASNVSIHAEAGVATGTQRTTTLSFGNAIDALNDVKDLTLLIDNCTPATAYIHRVALAVRVVANDVLAAWNEEPVYRSQYGFYEAATAADDYQDGGHINPPGTTESTIAFQNPADQLEALFRNRNWGLGLRAPTYTDPSAALTAYYAPSDTALAVTADKGVEFTVGDTILCNYELMRVTGISTDTLTVTRALDGSVATFHNSGNALYIVPTDGQVAIGSFRAAKLALQHTTGAELLTNGEMEAFTGYVATGWTEDDPDSKIEPTYETGYARDYGQQITRGATGGAAATGVRQAITTVITTPTWYRLSFWAKLTPAGNLFAQVQDGSNDGATWTFAATTAFQHFECIFKAWGTTTRIRLLTGAAANDVAVYDEVSVKKLTDWCWDHAILDEVDSRSWLDEACKEGGIRIIQDSTARTALRVLYPNRLPINRATWDSSVIARNQDGSPALQIAQTDRESVCTGVRVRYGYDHILKAFRGSVYVTTEQQSTGQVVTAYDAETATITVPDTSKILPSGRWASGESGGGSPTITMAGAVLTDTGATFTDIVQPGDWLCVATYQSTAGLTEMLALVESVTATTLTCRERLFDFAGGIGFGVWYTTFPYLYRVGGAICLPRVDGGPGTEDPNDLILWLQLESTSPYWSNGTGYSLSQGTPAVGDIVWRLVSDSDDHSIPGGFRDQTCTLRDNRERQSMVRVATYGQALPFSVDAPRIQDRETAVALRNYLFDYGQRHYIFNVGTDLSTIASEIGDQVTLTHDLVPGGSMPCEIIGQSIRLTAGRIDYVLKEVKGVPR